MPSTGAGRATAARTGAILVAMTLGAMGLLAWSVPARAQEADQTVQAAGTSGPGGLAVAMAPAAGDGGFWVATAQGTVDAEGTAPVLGDLSGLPLAAPIVGMAPTPTGNGYWLVAADGGIFSFGDAAFHGSTGNLHLNSPIVGMAPTPTGNGYWLVAADGGIFSFGDAAFHGSTGNLHLNSPIVGMAPTPTGNGYWLVAADGGIFSFGDAAFHGSTGNLHLNSPIVGMAPTPTGQGYRLVAADGGVFDFGDATYLGSAVGQMAGFSAVGLTTTTGAAGYWVVRGDGEVDAYGGAPALVTAPTVSAAACSGNPAGTRLLVVSISQQALWACQGPDLVSVSPVTTGASGLRNVHDATPTGTWHIQSKQTDVTLNGCDANGCWHDPVHFWVPFDGPYGFHDAPWQTFPFGGAAYVTGGSHGCVHLPEAEMAWVYAWAPIGTVVRIGT